MTVSTAFHGVHDSDQYQQARVSNCQLSQAGLLKPATSDQPAFGSTST
jgi:hypothetical protein